MLQEEREVRPKLKETETEEGDDLFSDEDEVDVQGKAYNKKGFEVRGNCGEE